MKRVLGLLALVLAVAGPVAAKSDEAGLRVEGLGVWRNRVMRQSLILLLGQQRGETIDANAIEDAALIVFSNLAERGYLYPTVRVKLVLADGRTAEYSLDSELDRPLPRPLAAKSVTFEVRRQRRVDITKVDFTGLDAIKSDQGQTYFYGQGTLAAVANERAYSPTRLHRSLGNLLEELKQRGYAEATVTAIDPPTTASTSKVELQVAVREGPLWRVREAVLEQTGDAPRPPDIATRHLGRPWSIWWRHDAETYLRKWYFEHGYPDARFEIQPEPESIVGGERAVKVHLRVNAGELVRLGKIRFVGNTRTHTWVLKPMVKAKPGRPLNREEIQDGQYRISRLGVFSSVDLQYDPATGPVRDAVYELKEGKKQDVDTLLGWGSFEELRGGVEWRNYDLFNIAHEGTLKLVQSLKSTEGEYDYTVPELLGTPADATAKLFGFRRNMRDFIDKQYGVTLSTTIPMPKLGLEAVTGYTFEHVTALHNNLASADTEPASANLASVQLELTRDRRDNPLLPRHGYKVALQLGEGSHALGGDVEYQQLLFQASYHTPWTRTRWFHFGLEHGLITSYGPGGVDASLLPPNILFFPGGEDSIRGYGQGQAAPRAATGQFLPARTFTLLNAELEQALTSKISALVFVDALGASATLNHYPWDYRLYSAGLGFRYQTIIGPVRLEYGRNLNPRPHDPPGTLQFSIGFPF